MNEYKLVIFNLFFILLTALSPSGLLAKDATSKKQVERISAVKTDAGEINFNLFNHLDPNSGVLQKIISVSKDNQTIQLANGSRWHVSKLNTIQGWGPKHRIVITQNHALFSLHKFALVNLDLFLAVPICLKTPPNPKKPESSYITDINFYQGVLSTNDTFQWVLNFSDRGLLNKFYVNSLVIIGANSFDESVDYPYLIIDGSLRTNDYLRATITAPSASSSSS